MKERFTFWANRRYSCTIEARSEAQARELAESQGAWEPCEPDWDGVGLGEMEMDDDCDSEDA